MRERSESKCLSVVRRTHSLRGGTLGGGVTYTVVDEGSLEGTGTNTNRRSFLAQPARYVRITMDIRTAATRLCTYETAVHGGERQTSLR